MIKFLIAVPIAAFFVLLSGTNDAKPREESQIRFIYLDSKPEPKPEPKQATATTDRIARHYEAVTNTYRHVSATLVERVVRYAHKHERREFPKAEDILAVIGIESSWNQYAVSNLKKDPAIGLTQIRPGIWAELVGTPQDLIDDPEKQVKYAAEILHTYYQETRNTDAAIIAYNAGIGSWRRGKYTLKYLTKFQHEKSIFRRSA